MNKEREAENILILYTELAAYNIACFEKIVNEYNVNLHIVRMPVNDVAPFDFKLNTEKIFLYDISNFNLESLIGLYDQIKPKGIFCSGWIIKMYLDLCKIKRRECITILGFDTRWTGSARQIFGSLYARFVISPNFHFAFVPGNSQAVMAQKMGFKKDHIITGFYSTNVDFFNEVFVPEMDRSKVIVFTGRYANEKGLPELCSVFMDLKNAGELKDWKLWCIGKGPYKIPQHPDILDLGFKQPIELKEVMKKGGVFILPSTYEPWGVVVHEFAAAG
ncbi:MAG TPA: glycosyltransferase, partial [Bacteroidia bacterium]|nr:glycosyltransferase [Bacteroidia bacterium]